MHEVTYFLVVRIFVSSRLQSGRSGHAHLAAPLPRVSTSSQSRVHAPVMVLSFLAPSGPKTFT